MKTILDEGSFKIDQVSTATWMEGEFFTSMGPELFFQMVKIQTEVFNNHAIILKPKTVYGQKSKI